MWSQTFPGYLYSAMDGLQWKNAVTVVNMCEKRRKECVGLFVEMVERAWAGQGRAAQQQVWADAADACLNVVRSVKLCKPTVGM